MVVPRLGICRLVFRHGGGRKWRRPSLETAPSLGPMGVGRLWRIWLVWARSLCGRTGIGAHSGSEYQHLARGSVCAVAVGPRRNEHLW